MKNRGYALLMVIMVLALIALGFGTVLFVVESNLTETRRILGESRCFYANDSASRIASATVQAVAVQEPPGVPNTQAEADALLAVCNIAGGCTGTPPLPVGIMPPDVTMTGFDITVNPTTGFRSSSAGPMRGVLVRDSGMSVYIEGQDQGTGRLCHVRDTFFSGTVSAFQFMMFAAGDADFYPHQSRVSPTPVYASGDLCIGAYRGTTFDMPRVGAGDDLHTSGGGSGRHRRRRPRRRAPIVCPGPNGGNGNVKVNGVAYTQPDYVNSFDQANVLTLPVSTVPAMQGDNTTDLLSVRWIVDPVQTAGDSAAVRSLKLADLADIRIIDGVWFVKAANSTWPGLPIYSDHPGQNVAPTGELATLLPSGTEVGLVDIQTALVAGGLLSSTAPWPPRRFSYYETNAAGALVDGGAGGVPGPNNVGVVSYGSLFVNAPNSFTPGAWPGWAGGLGGASDCGAAFAPFTACTSAAVGLLEGARSGFHDVNAQRRASGASASAEERILPMNFDVAQFSAAITDGAPGELGSYFAAGGAVGHEFNGIVWISATWDQQLTGLGAGAGAAASPLPTTLNPAQGQPVPGLVTLASVDAIAPVPSTAPLPQIQTATALTVGANGNFFLPHTLCSSTALAGTSLAGPFQNVGCSGAGGTNAGVAYGGTGQGGSRPIAVRLIHGADLSQYQPGAPLEISKHGLTVATNLPLYVMGDWNRVGPGVTTRFPRSMLAGDTITVLSGGFDDGAASWVVPAAPAPNPLAASETFPDDDGSSMNGAVIVRAGLLMGRTPATQRPANQDLEQLVRAVEQFSAAAPIVVRGAMMVGFTSVFRDDFQDVSALEPVPQLDFKYEVSLASPQFQPAGTPRFLAGVTGKWKDSR